MVSSDREDKTDWKSLAMHFKRGAEHERNVRNEHDKSAIAAVKFLLITNAITLVSLIGCHIF